MKKQKGSDATGLERESDGAEGSLCFKAPPSSHLGKLWNALWGVGSNLHFCGYESGELREEEEEDEEAAADRDWKKQQRNTR